MCQFIDQYQLRVACQYRIDVHFGESYAAVLDFFVVDYFQPLDQFRGFKTFVCFYDANH